MGDRIVPVAPVRRHAIAFLQSLGVSASDSEIAVDVMLEADLRGYGTQGLMRLEQTKASIDNDTIRPKAKLVLEKNSGATALYNGNHGLGYSLAKKAMEKCISLARRYGIGSVGVHDMGHVGMLSYYSELAAKSEMVGIVMTTTSPATVLPGGKKKIVGTNPISISIPYKEYPLTMDFSTSYVSRGALMRLAEANDRLPGNVAVDKDGIFTDDPKKALEGGVLPFGGRKGALLSLFIGILAGPLVGAEVMDRIKGTRFMTDKPNKGDLFISLDVRGFAGRPYLTDSLEYLEHSLSQFGGEIRVPGRRSYECKAERLEHGVELPEDILHLVGMPNGQDGERADIALLQPSDWMDRNRCPNSRRKPARVSESL